MLQGFRKHKRWMMALIIGPISIAFVATGIYSYSRSDSADTALAEVAGTKITPEQFDQAKREQLQALRNQMGDQFKSNILDNQEARAALLDRLMSDVHAGRQVIKLKDAKIVERESTAPIAPAAHLVERAIDFVERQATNGVRARDVVAHLGVSRALVSQRFREYGCRTLSDALARARLKAVRAKLRTTKMKIGAITAACGFPNADYAKRLFRKTYGLTMRDYRRSLAAHTPPHGNSKPKR